MATFTMLFKEVIATLYGTDEDITEYDQEYAEMSFGEVVYGKLPKLPEYGTVGLGTYPIFDPAYREILNGKIIDEFYNREIGSESIEMFKFNLRKKMDQIMPYYNQLYESQQIDYSALDSMRIHSVGETLNDMTEVAEGETTASTDTESGSRGVASNFPQTMLAGNGDYATSGNDLSSKSDVDATGTQKSDTKTDAKTNSDSLVTGYQGIASDLINKYRNSLISVDVMVLQELDDCFMQIFNNGDEYFAREYNYGWWF